jgi:hypothetical protein
MRESVAVCAIGDFHIYLAVAQQYLAQGDAYRHKFLAAFLTNI